MTKHSVRGELVPWGAGSDAVDMSRLAEQLVASAASSGVQLTGEGGLLTALTRQVLQAALEVEMAHHLGFAKRDPAGRGAANVRNGTTTKTVRTEIGEVSIEYASKKYWQTITKQLRLIYTTDEIVKCVGVVAAAIRAGGGSLAA